MQKNDDNEKNYSYLRKRTKRKTRKKTKNYTEKLNNNKNSSDSNLFLENSNNLGEKENVGITIDKKNQRRKSKKLSMKQKRIRSKFFSVVKKESNDSEKIDDKINKDNNYNGNITNNSDYILNIDFTFEHLIEKNDDEIERNELNDISYRQALRIDNRHLFEIFTSVFIKEIEILNIFYYRSPYYHFSLAISIYLLESLLDLTLNFLLYSDDVVSEKYNNNGEISFITSLTLSLISNIVSSS